MGVFILFYCGIDIAKNSHEASIIDARGKLLTESVSFSNSKTGCEKFFNLFEKFGIIPENVIIGMEATEHYWLFVYSFLIENKFNVKIINSIQSEAFKKLYICQAKNDSKDSFIIAQMMRFSQYSETKFSEENIVALRQLSRYRLNLVDACSDCKRRIITLLDRVYPRYQKFFSGSFGVGPKEILVMCPTSEDVLTISTNKLSKIFEIASNLHFGLEKTKNFKSISETSFVNCTFSFQINQLLRQIIFIENQIEKLKKQISTLLSRTNQVITTIPGIDETLGAIIIGEIGDIYHFNSPSKLIAFAGLNAKINQSGELSSIKNKLSKRNSPYLHRAILLAATKAAFVDPILSDYYQSLKSHGKHHLTAIGAVARKLCNIIFVILRENKPYQINHPCIIK